MKLLLIYATNSGGTLSASQTVSSLLVAKGHEVVVKAAGETDPGEVSGYEAIILGSPSWDFDGQEGMPHEDFIALLPKLKSISLDGKKFAIFGLGDSSYIHFCGAVDHLEMFVTEVKGVKIADSLKIDGYFYNQAKAEEQLKAWVEGLSEKLK